MSAINREELLAVFQDYLQCSKQEPDSEYNDGVIEAFESAIAELDAMPSLDAQCRNMRLIDADVLERYIQTEWENNRLCNEAWITFREVLKACPTINTMQWISSKEMLPDRDQVSGMPEEERIENDNT